MVNAGLAPLIRRQPDSNGMKNMPEEEIQDEEESEKPSSPPPEDENKEEGAPKAAAPAESAISADSDPITFVEEEEDSRGFFAKLNPMNLVRRNNPNALINEGKQHLDNQSYAQAMVSFNRALHIDKNNLPALRGLGKVFFKKGGRANMDTSLKYYQQAIKYHPKDHELYAISAKIYDSLGKRKEATLERKKFVIVRALDADAKNPIANNNMGILFLQQGRAKDALSYFQKSIDSDRNYDIAYRNMAAVYYLMAKDEEDPAKKSDFNSNAREAIEKAVSIAPSVPSLLALARLRLKDGHFDETLSLVEKLDEMAPANKDVYKIKKMALEGLGRFEEAKHANDSYNVFAEEAAAEASEAEEAADR